MGAWLCVAHLPHKLSMHFGDAIDAPRPLDTEVWGWVMWRGRPKCSNGAGDKKAQAVFQGPSPAHCEGLDAQQNLKLEFKHENSTKAAHVSCVCINETCDVDLVRQSQIGLTYSAEQSAVLCTSQVIRLLTISSRRSLLSNTSA